MIIGNLNGAELGEDRARALMAFVDAGGSLVVLGGSRSWAGEGLLATSLREAMPVRAVASQAVEEKCPVSLTPEGRAHPAFGGGAEKWDALPPVLSIFPGAVLTPGAQTLLTAATTTGTQPIVVTHRYGQGKVVAVLTDSLWRWQLAEGDDRPYGRFWEQLLAWLSPSEQEVDAYHLDLFTDRERVFLGENVELSARVGDGTDTPTEVRCRMTTPDGRVVPFDMTAGQVLAASGRAFEGFLYSFSGERPGLHSAVAEAVVAGRVITSEPATFYVKPYTPERVPRPIDTDVLSALAENSSGKFCGSTEQLNNVLSALWFEADQEETVEYASLWQRWPVITCLLMLLCLEWFLRKWRHMP